MFPCTTPLLFLEEISHYLEGAVTQRTDTGQGKAVVSLILVRLHKWMQSPWAEVILNINWWIGARHLSSFLHCLIWLKTFLSNSQFS